MMLRVIILAALIRNPFMRLRLLSLCFATVLLAACSSVQVSPVRPDMSMPTPGAATQAITRADSARTQDFPPADRDGYRPPARLAVVLPMTGSLSSAAASVRDGFLAAYYAETRQRPSVKFYDSQGSAGGAQAAVARALSDGAQMIVGPLSREEVNAVSGASTVPIIALNRGSQAPAGGTSFALLPDEEGSAAGNRLIGRGLGKVLVLSNNSDGARRAVAALRDTLARKGGSVVSEIALSGEIPDLAPQLSSIGSAAIRPDAVFLALEATQARLAVAQLKASSLAPLPRMATSQILSGGNARTDIELDGVEYPELPWMLDQASGLPNAATLARSMPSARGPAQRLFAFGADAWLLAAYFERLYNEPGYAVRGATGALRIDVTGPVQRLPTWAVFSGGRGRASYESTHSPDDSPTP